MINVLVVVDGFGGRNVSFSVVSPGDAFFSLTYFMQALNDPTFNVTKAHRGVDPGNPTDASVTMNFRFDQQPLIGYDVILLFGFCSDSDVHNSGHPERLSDTELFALATFMQNGGGVFATGDHESLGRPLCGLVPRVRSMRKWFFPPDNGSVPRQYNEPDAPPAIAQTIAGQMQRRLDTTMVDWNDLDPSGGNWFDNQSDDIPQVLEFKYPVIDGRYVCWADPVYGSWGAHPLWYTTVGISRSYPDHMHEGEIITPWESNRVFTFNSTSFTEYPPATGGGATPMPQIIAWSYSSGVPNENHNGEPHVGDPEPADYRPFGAVGAYDGRPAGVGRVLVDSTFHHFVDINLIGDPAAPTGDPKRQGFQTTDGQPVHDARGQFYRNIVLWLAPPQAQMAIWHAHLSSALQSVAVREAAPPAGQARSIRAFGNGIMNRLRTRLSEPMIWGLATANLEPSVVGAIASGMPNPCGGEPEGGVPVRATIAQYLVGATALEVLTASRKSGTASSVPRAAALDVIRAGQRRGLELLSSESSSEARRLAAWAEKLHHSLEARARSM